MAGTDLTQQEFKAGMYAPVDEEAKREMWRQGALAFAANVLAHNTGAYNGALAPVIGQGLLGGINAYKSEETNQRNIAALKAQEENNRQMRLASERAAGISMFDTGPAASAGAPQAATIPPQFRQEPPTSVVPQNITGAPVIGPSQPQQSVSISPLDENRTETGAVGVSASMPSRKSKINIPGMFQQLEKKRQQLLLAFGNNPEKVAQYLGPEYKMLESLAKMEGVPEGSTLYSNIFGELYNNPKQTEFEREVAGIRRLQDSGEGGFASVQEGILRNKGWSDIKVDPQTGKSYGMKGGVIQEIPAEATMTPEQPKQTVYHAGGNSVENRIFDPNKKLFPNAEHDKNGFAILGRGEQQSLVTLDKNAFAQNQAADFFKTELPLAKGAVKTINSVNNMRDQLESGIFSGGGASARVTAINALKGWGVPVPDDWSKKLANSQAFGIFAGQQLLAHAKDLGYNPTDADARRIEAIVGTIDTDPNALVKAMDYMEKIARRDLENFHAISKQIAGKDIGQLYDPTILVPIPETRRSKSSPQQTAPEGLQWRKINQ